MWCEFFYSLLNDGPRASAAAPVFGCAGELGISGRGRRRRKNCLYGLGNVWLPARPALVSLRKLRNSFIIVSRMFKDRWNDVNKPQYFLYSSPGDDTVTDLETLEDNPPNKP